jgi:DNA-directed RNA polymerase subunit N (RpoN/RPB10)
MMQNALLEKIHSYSCCSGWHEVILKSIIEYHEPFEAIDKDGIQRTCCKGCWIGYKEGYNIYPCHTVKEIIRAISDNS